MKLSSNFELDEFLRSETAARMGRLITDPPQEVIDNLAELCINILEPARSLCGNRAVTPLSGYRPRWLNHLVGGANDSDHILGGAADIRVFGLTPLEVCTTIAHSDLPFRQLILEFGAWTHISKPRNGEVPRREVLTAKKVGGRTIYEQGIQP